MIHLANGRGADGRRLLTRQGMTLIEVMVAMTLLAIVGIGLMRILSAQMRFADTQIAMKDAREVARASLNALTSDVRMVDADSGITAATSTSFTVLAPYAAGVVCGAASGSGSVIALLPYDSAGYAEGGYAGYAYIDTTTSGTSYSQIYQYVHTTTTPTTIDSATAATTSPCKTSTDRFGVFRTGAVTVQPAIPAHSTGQAAFLFRTVTYAFKPSVTVPGTIGLFRTVRDGVHGDEELVAPFSAAAKFLYLLNDGTIVSSATGSALQKIRGIQLQLTGTSEHVIPGTTQLQTAPMLTTIFFKNRPLQ